MEAKKLKDATIAEMDVMFRRCATLVGLRTQFFPNDLELLVLYQFIQENYGNMSIEDVNLAFTKVATGELGDDCKLYDYFSPIYFGTVMKKYKNWAGETANRIADQKYIQKLKEDDMNKPAAKEIDWRATIEFEYQQFLQGTDNSALFFPDMYKVLVEDGSFPEELWKKKIDSTRREAIADLQKQIAVLETTNLNDAGRMQQFNFVNDALKEYKAGGREKNIEAIAKAKVIKKFFEHNKAQGVKNLYVPK